MTKRIKLTKGYFALVDNEYFEFHNQWNWHAKEGKNTVYAVRTEGSGVNKKNIKMHREIMNAPKGIEVDHKNGNGLDNRKRNLRYATHQQNQMNKGPQSNNKSGYPGVHLEKGSGKWIAYIKLDGKHINLGRFEILGDAVKVRKAAEKKYFGSFARP